MSATVPLNIRIKPAVRNVIDRAAELTGKTRTDFMIEASEQRAVDVLLDRSVITVDPETYAAFVERLDAPPEANERLRRTITTVPPWSKG